MLRTVALPHERLACAWQNIVFQRYKRETMTLAAMLSVPAPPTSCGPYCCAAPQIHRPRWTPQRLLRQRSCCRAPQLCKTQHRCGMRTTALAQAQGPSQQRPAGQHPPCSSPLSNACVASPIPLVQHARQEAAALSRWERRASGTTRGVSLPARRLHQCRASAGSAAHGPRPGPKASAATAGVGSFEDSGASRAQSIALEAAFDEEEEDKSEGGDCEEEEGDENESWEEGSCITGYEFPIMKRIANKLRYGDERGYFVGSRHWMDSVDTTAGEMIFRQQTPHNGVITIRQHGEFRALRSDRVLQSVTLVAGEPPVPSARSVVFGYVRAMAAAAATFLELQGRQSLQQEGTRLICLGIGGGALPALFAAQCPAVAMDAVDLDPVVIRAAGQLLSLAAPEAVSVGADLLRLHEGDAATYMRGVLLEEDVGCRPAVIFLDCYDNKGRVPAELTTTSFIADCLQALAPGGVLVVNHFNDDAGTPARRRLASFGLLSLELAGDGHVFTVKVQNQASNVIMAVLKPEPAPSAPPALHGRGMRQAAKAAGAAANFSFDTAAELSELFRVEIEMPDGTFSELRL